MMDEPALEAEEGFDSRTREVYPDAVVKISRDQYSVFEIKRMAEKEPVELVVAPEFQRREVWTLEQKRELIESVLMGIPLPVVYVFENENGLKQVVDGRQRISTLMSCLNNEFALTKLTMLPQLNTKKFQDLEPIYQSKIERYQIAVYVIEPPTPERVKYDIFDRVNRGGTQLNSQEMRNALYCGPATRLVRELSELQEFKDATGDGIKSKRMRDQYLIVRFLAFYLLRQKMLSFTYKSNIDDLLAESMKYMNALSDNERTALKNAFIRSMRLCFTTLGGDAFRFAVQHLNRRPINMPLFETLAYFFAMLPADRCNPDMVREKINSLKIAFDSSGYFSSRVDSTKSVEFRFGKVEKLAGELT